ncbi:LMBR1 domain-containing protein 2-like [Mucor ambiguus]|uniref:LMBR1 domain-containing protein 2-like n=1 Tax=Mucor ambiguus TaxID=91626 RepID=A0A0C9MDQ1_9FUNG|nr:LMBR1 domain-containing protein 2-like [Mucor ambiguus]
MVQQDLPIPTNPAPPEAEPPLAHHSDWLPLVLMTCLMLTIVLFTLSRYGNIKSQPWYTVHDDKKGRVPFAYVSQHFLFVAWRVLYWTSFCLTWMAIPMMQAYVNTGDFTIVKRLKSAVQCLEVDSQRGKLSVSGFHSKNREPDHSLLREGIQSYVMAAANSWGLFLVIVFMGYGLVSVPRSLWYSGSYDRHLFQHYANATRLKEECMDSELEFNELAKTMNAISKRAMMEIPEIRHCINVMNRRFPFVLHEAFAERDSSITIPRDLTEEYLVKISKRMILAIRMRDRKNALWKNLLNEAFYLQDIIKNKDKRDRRFTSTLRSKENTTKWTDIKASIGGLCHKWWWMLRIAPNLNKFLAIVFSVISVCIIWSEIVFNVRRPVIISIVYYVLNACGTNYAALEIMAFFTLMYMCICVYSSLFKIRFFNLYILIPNHHTDENSLLWFTGYMCKMMAPLCYNFINLAVDAPGVSKAVFTTFMGKADLIKFLGAFADWFPIIILIPSLSLLFNVQGRCLGFCGIKSPYQNSDDDDINNNDDTEANNGALLDADVEEGSRLVKEERRLKEREINPSARISVQSARNREYTNKKYHRANVPDTLRNERDRRVEEILSGNTSQHERYRDSPASSSASSFSANENASQPVDAMKLKTNLISFGDTMKHKLGGLFGTTKSNTEEAADTPSSSPSPSPSSHSNLRSSPSPPPINTINQHTAGGPGGRVFGRPVTNENHRPFHTAAIEESSSRPLSPNPFLMASSGLNRQQLNNNISPFARFEDVSSSTSSRPNNNMFDDI